MLFLLVLIVLTFACAAHVHAGQPGKSTQGKKAAKNQVDAPSSPARLEIEPKAVEIVKAACERLATAKTVRFTAIVEYEYPSLLGPALVYTTRSEVAMQRPDKLRIITPGDGPATEFYYDGKAISALSPAEKMIAVAEAPPTIDAALQAAYDLASIYFPFTDILVADPYKDLSEGLRIAFYIGQSRVVGGVTTDMVALANDAVFLQIWIGAEDRLPRMVRAVYRDDPSRLRHGLTLSNWKLDDTLPADTFTPSVPADAISVSFARPDPQLPPAPTPARFKEKPKATPGK